MKTLNIAAGTNNSWFISLQVKKGDGTKKINVSLNRSEFATLQVIAKVSPPPTHTPLLNLENTQRGNYFLQQMLVSARSLPK